MFSFEQINVSEIECKNTGHVVRHIDYSLKWSVYTSSLFKQHEKDDLSLDKRPRCPFVCQPNTADKPNTGIPERRYPWTLCS